MAALENVWEKLTSYGEKTGLQEKYLSAVV